MRSPAGLSLVALVASTLSAITGCAHRSGSGDNMTQDEQAIRVVKDTAADAASVLAAVAHVPAGAPASLWSDVANDAGFAVFHRSLAAWQLVKRHLPPGIALGDAAQQLAGATWLDGAGLEKITAITGEIPVVVPPHGAAFILRLPRGSAAEIPDLGAYLALDRDTDVATLRAALQARPDGAALTGAHLTGVALFPDRLGSAAN
jgi:hypothetical protein